MKDDWFNKLKAIDLLTLKKFENRIIQLRYLHYFLFIREYPNIKDPMIKDLKVEDVDYNFQNLEYLQIGYHQYLVFLLKRLSNLDIKAENLLINTLEKVKKNEIILEDTKDAIPYDLNEEFNYVFTSETQSYLYQFIMSLKLDMTNTYFYLYFILKHTRMDTDSAIKCLDSLIMKSTEIIDNKFEYKYLKCLKIIKENNKEVIISRLPKYSKDALSIYFNNYKDEKDLLDSFDKLLG